MTLTSLSSDWINQERLSSLVDRQKAIFVDRTKGSKESFERARKVMPGGVPSQFQLGDPWPVFIERGAGAKVWDVDGNEYRDFHNGFGVMCVGHANPKIAAAVSERITLGSHFAAPTQPTVEVAEELRDRWGLPFWRFTNSGTESTMDAVHLARGFTGRQIIIKMEGSYHGHHDSVMVSVKPDPSLMGDPDHPVSIAFGLGHLASAKDNTRAVQFNDAAGLERLMKELEGQVAAVILEPAMMNINIVMPVDGYLKRVRELTREHGAQLIFDEVKTGAAIARGGATELFGVTPDIVCLAKAICGGLPGGAVGMTDELAELVAAGKVRQQGTFNGNPLVMAAAKTALTEVLTTDAYRQLHADNEKLLADCRRIIDQYGLPAHTEGMGSKGCVVFSTETIRNYRDYLTKIDHRLTTLAWLYHMNSGIFMTPGEDEQWTLSVMHTAEDYQRYIDAFERFAKDVTS